jgi:hypothetical protein
MDPHMERIVLDSDRETGNGHARRMTMRTSSTS